MRRWIVLSGLGLLVLVVAIQFIPVGTANPPVESDIPTSPAVKAVLRRACYDCHSHETVWPWYSHIAPVSWLLAYEMRQGGVGGAQFFHLEPVQYPTTGEEAEGKLERSQ